MTWHWYVKLALSGTVCYAATGRVGITKLPRGAHLLRGESLSKVCVAVLNHLHTLEKG